MILDLRAYSDRKCISKNVGKTGRQNWIRSLCQLLNVEYAANEQKNITVNPAEKWKMLNIDQQSDMIQ